jgi:hypothetical protein
MDTHEQPQPSSATTIAISAYSHSRPSCVSAVERVQLPSPFLLGSNAPASAAAPASPIWLPACGGDDVNVGFSGGEWAYFAGFDFKINKSRLQNNHVEMKVKLRKFSLSFPQPQPSKSAPTHQ